MLLRKKARKGWKCYKPLRANLEFILSFKNNLANYWSEIKNTFMNCMKLEGFKLSGGTDITRFIVYPQKGRSIVQAKKMLLIK
jgi:hypothetical protein